MEVVFVKLNLYTPYVNWFFIALIPPLLWAVNNHIDKYLLSRYFKSGGIGALLVFSSLIGVPIVIGIAIFSPGIISVGLSSVFVATTGIVYILALIPYLYALRDDEASLVVPLFQLIPVVSYLLAFFFLGETLTANQILGGFAIVVGGILIQVKHLDGRTFKFNHKVFWLMIASSLLFSLSFFLFKFFSSAGVGELNFWQLAFWEYVGFSVTGLLLLGVPQYRKEFFKVLSENKISYLGINVFAEMLNISAKLLFNYVSLFIPLALIWSINGTQGFFVVLVGALLTLFFPSIAKEDISKKGLAHKALAVFVIIIGAFVINF